MKKINFLGVITLAALAFAVRASEKTVQPVQPIGYFVETINDEEQSKTSAKFTRDGEEYDVVSGMEVFPGDVVNTATSGGVLIAFVNSNTVQLQGEAQATLNEVTDPATSAQVTINSGHATVITRDVSSNFAFDMGDSKMPLARAAIGFKPASLDIFVQPNGSGGFVTNVAVLAGTVTLTPRAGGLPVDLASLGTALLTFNTATNPPSGMVNTGNIDKKALKGLKVGNVSDILLKVGKSSVSIKATIVNADGSIAKGSVTTSFSGAVTKDSWKTKGVNKFSESWTETVATGKITAKQTFNGITFSASFPTGKASIKDAVNKQSYTGIATYDKNTGIITFTTTKPGRDGSTATYTYNPNSATGQSFTAVITGGTGAGTITTTVATKSPVATTPDKRGVTQNAPPASQ